MYEFRHLGAIGKVIEDAAQIKNFSEIEDALDKLKHHLNCIQIEYV